MTLRPCLHAGCAKLVTTSYCKTHALLHVRRRPTDERQSYAWKKARAQAIEDQPWCSYYRSPDCRWNGDLGDLQLGHRKRVADGGTAANGTEVVCSTCNQRTNRRVTA